MKNPVKVITVGSVVEDLFVLVSESRIIPGPDPTCEKLLAFEYGAKIPVGRIQTCLGGAGSNVAVGLKRLGIETMPCVAFGNDGTGIRLKRELRRNGLDTALCQIADHAESDRSIVLVEPIDRDRTIFYNRQAGDHLRLKDISKWKTEWVFVSSLSVGWEKKLGQILKLHLEKNVRIALNPGRTQIKAGIRFLSPLLKETSLLFLNWDEALELALSDKKFREEHASKKPNKKEVMKFLHWMGVKVIVITFGRKGAIASDGHYFYQSPGASPKRVEITGAGDAFASGFLASWIREPGDLRRAMGWGSANASNAILYFGAQKGLLNFSQMKRKVNEVILEATIREEKLY